MRIDQVLDPTHGRPEDVVVSAFKVDMPKRDMLLLQPGQWLNDEVINFYEQLVRERNEKQSGRPKLHAFSSFFYTKVCVRLWLWRCVAVVAVAVALCSCRCVAVAV